MLAVSPAGHWERIRYHQASTCLVLVFHAVLIIQYPLHLDCGWGGLRFQPFFGVPTKHGVPFFLELARVPRTSVWQLVKGLAPSNMELIIQQSSDILPT